MGIAIQWQSRCAVLAGRKCKSGKVQIGKSANLPDRGLRFPRRSRSKVATSVAGLNGRKCSREDLPTELRERFRISPESIPVRSKCDFKRTLSETQPSFPLRSGGAPETLWMPFRVISAGFRQVTERSSVASRSRIVHPPRPRNWRATGRAASRNPHRPEKRSCPGRSPRPGASGIHRWQPSGLPGPKRSTGKIGTSGQAAERFASTQGRRSRRVGSW